MNNGCGHSQAPLQPHFVKLQCRGGLHRDLQQVGCSWVLLLVCPVKETLQVWEFGKLCCALHCSKAELVGFLPTVENQYKIKPVDYKKGSSNTSNQRLLRFIFKWESKIASSGKGWQHIDRKWLNRQKIGEEKELFLVLLPLFNKFIIFSLC